VDTRTEAEKRRDAHMAKYERERAKKAATKSHRERIHEMNKYLEGLSEHHDIPKTSYSYM
jgi:protein FAM32A